MRRFLSVLGTLGVVCLVISTAGCPGKKNTATTPKVTSPGSKETPKTQPSKETPTTPKTEEKKEESKKEETKKEETKKAEKEESKKEGTKKEEAKKGTTQQDLNLPPPPPSEGVKKGEKKGASAIWKRDAVYATLIPALWTESNPWSETALLPSRRYRG